jgi:hypothetical protein
MKAKKCLPLLFIAALLAAGVARANDGVFYASGNTLVPLEETQVELRRERLKFFVRDHEYLNVEIDFEFSNPGAARRLLVGFVTPPAAGDVPEEATKHPFITDFAAIVNDRKIPYKVARMNDTFFRRSDEELDGNDFVYYFPVTFQNGLNRIRHTYRFRGDSGVELQRGFSYQITTGRRWANKQIDDFELQIHLDHGIFAVPASFQADGSPADWQIVGDGVIEEQTRRWFSEDAPRVRMVHLNSGFLQFREKNFRPDRDIFFGEYNWAAGWTSIWCDFAQQCIEPESLEKIARFFNLNPSADHEESDFAELGAREFKYLRNYFYAVRGLAFKDERLRKFYSQFFWYKPKAGVTLGNTRLSEAESRFLALLKRYEEKRKN